VTLRGGTEVCMHCDHAWTCSACSFCDLDVETGYCTCYEVLERVFPPDGFGPATASAVL